MMIKIFNIQKITVKSYKISMRHPYKITKVFQIQLVSLNLLFLTRVQKLQEPFGFVCSLVLPKNFPGKLEVSCKSFAVSEHLEVFSCSSHRSSTLRLVSPMYVCSQIHTPSHMAQAGRAFLLFSLKSRFTLFVIHFILILFELLVSLLMNFVEIF